MPTVTSIVTIGYMNDLNPENLFKIANSIALVSWIILILFPGWRITRLVVKSGAVSLVLAIGYWLALAMVGFVGIPSGAGFGSLAAVKSLFSSDWGLLAGWVHYLAFDLLVGVQVQTAMNRNSYWLRSLCLILIFMFGPVGWSLSRLFAKRNNHG